MTIKDETGQEVPYNSFMYKRIVQECYLISHQINTSYTDLMNVTPLERRYMLEMLNDEARKRNEQLEELKKKQEDMRFRNPKFSKK